MSSYLFDPEEFDSPEADYFSTQKKGSETTLEPTGLYSVRGMVAAEDGDRCEHPRQITLEGELCWECGKAWPLKADYSASGGQPVKTVTKNEPPLKVVAKKVSPAQKGGQPVKVVTKNEQPVVDLSDRLPAPVTVHSLINEPGLLLAGSGATYIGRKNKRYAFRVDSPLANPFALKDKKNDRKRDEVCNAQIGVLIKVLQTQKGPTWDELKRLAQAARKGTPVKLLCYCNPKRCHGDGVAITISGLAVQKRVSEIIAQLESLLPGQRPDTDPTGTERA